MERMQLDWRVHCQRVALTSSKNTHTRRSRRVTSAHKCWGVSTFFHCEPLCALIFIHKAYKKRLISILYSFTLDCVFCWRCVTPKFIPQLQIQKINDSYENMYKFPSHFMHQKHNRMQFLLVFTNLWKKIRFKHRTLIKIFTQKQANIALPSWST